MHLFLAKYLYNTIKKAQQPSPAVRLVALRETGKFVLCELRSSQHNIVRHLLVVFSGFWNRLWSTPKQRYASIGKKIIEIIFPTNVFVEEVPGDDEPVLLEGEAVPEAAAAAVVPRPAQQSVARPAAETDHRPRPELQKQICSSQVCHILYLATELVGQGAAGQGSPDRGAHPVPLHLHRHHLGQPGAAIQQQLSKGGYCKL